MENDAKNTIRKNREAGFFETPRRANARAN